jgi:DNA-binding IclR family transcriptional regulator
MGAGVATQTGTQAVDRAASILGSVLTAPGPVSFTELAAASGLPKSTLSRLLGSLERGGLIRRQPDGSVSAGACITDYALRVRPEEDLAALAQPAMQRLSDLTGETINLGVTSGRDVRQVAQVDSRFVMGAVNWLDRPVPLHCSALGKVFLAGGTPLPQGRLERRTDRTHTTRAALQADLDLTRRRGYAVADGELEPGLIAVAAPIRGADDVVVGALSVSGPDARITRAAISRIGAALVRETTTISRSLQSVSRKVGAA